jgi:DNA-binding NarL/FixJ family response regulator
MKSAAAVGVLIVDDHDLFRSRARAMLESAGFDVLGEADDAAHAVEQCSRLQPDLVLLDVQLPDHDGFWVAEQLRRQPDGPLVVLTSSREAEDYGSKLSEATGARFIQKSDLSRETLQALVSD